MVLGSVVTVHALDGSKTHYMDGEGYLASSNGQGGVTETFQQDGRGKGPFSFGLRLCLRDGASKATLIAVAPHQLVGDSLLFKGSLARDVDVSNGSAQTPIASAPGLPAPPINVYPTRARLRPYQGLCGHWPVR